jgi:hypothetical protein
MARGKYEASHPAVVAFLKWLGTSRYLQHLSWYTRFRAVVELWFAAVTRNEKDYLARVEELTPDAVRGGKTPRIMEHDGACSHFAKLWLAMGEEPQDLLGEAYQAYSVKDTKNLAQYFTPDSVAACMAEMQIANAGDDQWRKPEGCRILEPACGSGVMVIHMLRAIHARFGQWALNRTEVVLCDLDPLCVKMAGVQMAWLPWPVGSVTLLQGDSLRMEQTIVARLGRGVAPSPTRIVRKVEVPQCG